MRCVGGRLALRAPCHSGGNGDHGAARTAQTGTDVNSLAVLRRGRETRIDEDQSALGKPMQIAVLVSTNGSFRGDLVTDTRFSSLVKAREEVTVWKAGYD